MKYLIRNEVNVVDMVFQMPMTPGSGMNVISVDDAQFRIDMVDSIFIDINNYKPKPKGSYWASDGVNWVDSRTDDEVWDDIRLRRDEELAATDWTQLADSGLNPGEVNLWATYRAKIRDAGNTVSVGSPRVAEVVVKEEISDRKPGRVDTDPRRGRGQGGKATRPEHRPPRSA